MWSVAGGRAAARGLAVLLASIGLAVTASTWAAPAWAAPGRTATAASAGVVAAPSTDLGVTLTNKADAVPGKRVTYLVTVTNKGNTDAHRVRIDFTTSAALSGVSYTIRNGSCDRGAKETTCQFWSPLKAGRSTRVTISGVMPKRLKKGTPVANRVSARSSTKLTNTADDQATDNYRIGVPRNLPVPDPNASANAQSKILRFTDTASHLLGYAKQALRLTLIVLGAAALWFAIGLYVRHRQRLARGEYGDE